MQTDWNKKITLTREELYQLIITGFKTKPSNRIKCKSSFNTAVFTVTQEIVGNMNKLFKD